MNPMGQVDLEITDGCAVVTLNNPTALNAWSRSMQRRVGELMAELDADDDVKGIVLTGAGDRAFCSGQDLNELETFTTDHVEGWLDTFYHVYNAVLGTSKPVVAALNGVTAGSGYQLALLCDLRIAHSGVRIGQPEVNSGIPSITGMYLTWQSLGHSKTTELMLTGRLMSAEEAHQLGLIAEILPQDEVLTRSKQLVEELARLPKQAFRLTKQRVHATLLPGLKDAFDAALASDRKAYDDGEPQATAGAFLSRGQETRDGRGSGS